MFETLATALQRLLPYDGLKISRVDLDAGLAHGVYAAGAAAEEFMAVGVVELGSTMTGRAAAQGEALLVNDLHLDPEAVHIPGTAEGEEQSSIAVPLLDEEGIVSGVLYVTASAKITISAARSLASSVASRSLLR